MTHGSIGDRDCDGWVVWELVDDGFSYNPSLSCGDFAIVLGKGTTWGAPSEDHGQLAIVDFELEAEYGENEVGHLDFAWCRDGFVAAVREVVRLMDHPAPINVIDAALELWTAILFDEVR